MVYGQASRQGKSGFDPSTTSIGKARLVDFLNSRLGSFLFAANAFLGSVPMRTSLLEPLLQDLEGNGSTMMPWRAVRAVVRQTRDVVKFALPLDK